MQGFKELINRLGKKIKEAFIKVQDYAKSNKKLFSLYIILGVLCIVLIIGLASGWGTAGKKESADKEIDIENVQVKQDEITEINTLINDYYTARVNADVGKISELTDNTQTYTEEQLKQSIVESYNNISCYVAEGQEEDTFIVFAYWEVKLVNTDTLAPGIDSFYVVRDEESGKYLIHAGMGDDVEEYISALTENSKIKAFFEETNNKFNAAVNSDDNLKALYDYFNQAPAETESTSGETQETTAQGTD